MGVKQVLFSDAVSVDLAQSNFSSLKENHEQIHGQANFVQYDWKDIYNGILPKEFKFDNTDGSIITWDTIILSDILYDSTCHQPLLEVLQQLSFKQLLIAYKIRHGEVEMLFFQSLSEWCNLRVIEESSFERLNLSNNNALAGLFIVVAVPLSKC